MRLNALLPVSISAPPASTTVCAGSSTGFSVTASHATGYQWQVSSGGAFTDLPNTAPYSGVTTAILSISAATALLNGYQYRVVVSGSGVPAVPSDAATLTVNSLPLVSISPVSTTVYSGQSVTLTATGASTYIWSTGVMTNPITFPALVGTTPYSVTGTDGNGCLNTATAQLTGVALPALRAPASLCVKSTGNTKTLLTLPLTMTLTGGMAPYTYSWAYKAPGSSYKAIPLRGISIGKVSLTPVSGSASLTLSGEKGNLNGLQGYMIQLTVTDKNGLSATATTLLDGSCTLPGARQGVESEETLQVVVFPNPVVDVLQLEVSGLSEPAQISLYDVTGRPAGQWTMEPQAGVGQLKAAVSHLSEGIYILQVATQEGVLHSSRVLKQR